MSDFERYWKVKMLGKLEHKLTKHLKAVAKDSWRACAKTFKQRIESNEAGIKRLSELLNEAMDIGRQYEKEIEKLRAEIKDLKSANKPKLKLIKKED